MNEEQLVQGCSLFLVLLFVLFSMAINWEEFMCHFTHMGSFQQLKCVRLL